MDPAPAPHGLPGLVIGMNTILYCEKWPETVAFYRTGLQLPVTVSKDWFVEFRLTDTARLSIADAGRATRDTTRGQGHLITFQVKDMAETRARLCRAGLNPTPVTPHAWGADVMYLIDPEGNCLEFWCRPPHALQKKL
jgi:predicted enzyme related to lactoylglutathione lyase